MIRNSPDADARGYDLGLLAKQEGFDSLNGSSATQDPTVTKLMGISSEAQLVRFESFDQEEAESHHAPSNAPRLNLLVHPAAANKLIPFK